MLKTKLITAPTFYPVSLDLMKSHLRITNTSEDDDIIDYVRAATNYIENYTGLKLTTQTWDYYMDDFPGGTDKMFVPFPPLQSITSIKYQDGDDAQQTWDSSNYTTDIISWPGRVEYVTGWPSTYDKINAVVVRFVCGYSDEADIPYDLKAAVKLFAAHLFENRQQVSVVMGSVNKMELPLGVHDLIDKYVIFNQQYH